METIAHKEVFGFCNTAPLTLIAGLNVLEDADLAMNVAQYIKDVCTANRMRCVFKASFDKANRSSVNSYRGPGLVEGLKQLAAVKQEFGLPIITDVHEINQVERVADVVDILQLPAFLCRQTDLVRALAMTGKPVNIKKAQFLAPEDVGQIAAKFEAFGNDQLILCERGTVFGYHNLVVDMLGFSAMKKTGYPVVFDATHALQQPTALVDSSGNGCAGGRRGQVLDLARAGISQGIAGLFLEVHPRPEDAKCDGPCALRLSQLAQFVQQVKALDDLIKSLPAVDTN